MKNFKFLNKGLNWSSLIILSATLVVSGFFVFNAGMAEANGVLPSVILDTPTNVYRPAPFDVTSATINPEDGTAYSNVRFNIIVSGPDAFPEGTARADIFTITKVDGSTDTQGINNTFELVGGDFVGYWGPVEGFPLPVSYEATSIFTVQMCDVTTAPVGNYNLTVELVNLTPDPDVTLASATDGFSLSADSLYVGAGQQFTTIQDAISAASSGDTIEVADGTYTITAAINVNKDVTITGNIANPENVLVKYNSAVTDKNCFDITANNVNIQGIKAINGEMGFYLNGVIGCKVSNCIVSSCADKGIYVRNCPATSEATRVEVTGNIVSDCGNTWGAACIQTYISPYTYIYNNIIDATNDKGINIIRSGATGETDRVQVIGNIISGTKWPGIQVIGSPYTNVYDNILTGCNYQGADETGDWDYASIHVQDDDQVSPTVIGDYVIIDSNTVSDGINGIQTWSNDVTITNNEIYNMGVTYADTKTTGDGTYKNSGILVGSMYGDDPTGVVIENNNIHDNYWGLFYSADLTTGVIAKNNWWGGVTGPKQAMTNPCASGDEVSDNIDYTPWLDAAYPDGSGRSYNVENITTSNIYNCIQEAITAATAGDTIVVAAGTYAGAIVDKAVTVSGAPGGTSIITSGVPYKAGNDVLHSAFRPEADGAEIRNFTINCDVENDLDLGVYAVEVDDVTVDSLTINNGTIQGISNWGGSGWVITNNVITDTVASGGGGIGIFLGAKAQQQCVGNLIQFNTIDATATAETYSCAGIAVCLDTRYGGYDLLDSSENVSGNQILDNVIAAAGTENSVGIEVGTILGNSEDDPLRTNPEAIAALMAAAAVHDNLVQDNSIDGAETGVYFYNVTGLTITQNEINNSVDKGIYAEHAHSGTVVQFNNIIDNTQYGIEVDPTATGGPLNATNNWWGKASGPGGEGKGNGDAVSTNVDYRPWLLEKDGSVFDQTIAVTEAGKYALVSADQLLSEVPTITDDEGASVSALVYLNGTWYSTDDTFNADIIKPVSAFFVKPTNKAGVGFNYATGITPGQTSNKDLSVGWNLVGTNNAGSAQNEFSSIQNTGSGGMITLYAPDTYNARKDYSHTAWSTDANHDLNANPVSGLPERDLSEYDGYWTYLDIVKTFSKILSE